MAAIVILEAPLLSAYVHAAAAEEAAEGPVGNRRNAEAGAPGPAQRDARKPTRGGHSGAAGSRREVGRSQREDEGGGGDQGREGDERDFSPSNVLCKAFCYQFVTI